ncbi:MAG: 3-isopropylmalate dehydrogenase, partial [Chloroflexi bacterium]|nr:3-isopropylmalate dehydrogenase [Chloroflexota bacterium]
MAKYRIGVIAGDGIGPEVVAQGLRVLERLGSTCGFDYELEHFPFGADHYLGTGELLPDSAIEQLRGLNAIFLGAIGDPRVPSGLLEREILLKLRFQLDLYVNLRPIVLYSEHLCPLKDKRPEDVDFIFVRENTEDVYAGITGYLKKDTPDEVASAQMIFTRAGVDRALRYGFELARKRNKQNKLTVVNKSNAIRIQDIWERAAAAIAPEFPEIKWEQAYVDATAMWMVKNPEWFDVVVTTNMFGDILSDLGAMIQGGLGLAASGNLHPGRVSMFEPIHGSAPKYKG